MKNHRRGIVIWVYSLKNLAQLKKIGYIQYVSRRMQYVVMYIDEKNKETILEKINKLHFVRSVEYSYLPDIDMTFQHAIENRNDKDKVAIMADEL